MSGNSIEIEVHVNDPALGVHACILPATFVHRLVIEKYCEPCTKKPVDKNCKDCEFSKFIDLAYKYFSTGEVK